MFCPLKKSTLPSLLTNPAIEVPGALAVLYIASLPLSNSSGVCLQDSSPHTSAVCVRGLPLDRL